MNDDVPAPGPDFSGSGPVEYHAEESHGDGSLELLRARLETQFLAVPGVTFVGIGGGVPGGQALSVGVVDAGVAAMLPSSVEGVPVIVTVTGEVDALSRP